MLHIECAVEAGVVAANVDHIPRAVRIELQRQAKEEDIPF